MHLSTMPAASYMPYDNALHITYLQFFKELSSCIGAWTPEDPQLCIIEEGF